MEEIRKKLHEQYGEGVELRTAELRSAEDGLVLEGYAAVFNQETQLTPQLRERIAPEAFGENVQAHDVRFLLNHAGAPLARTTNGTLQLQVDDYGLHYRAELSDTQASRDLYTMVKRGDISQSSFAFKIDKQSISDANVRTIESISDVYDVSAVTYPAYEQSSVTARDNSVETEKESIILDTENKKQMQPETLKDLLAARQQAFEAREIAKEKVERAERDFTDDDIAELRKYTEQIEALDRKITVKRDDQKLMEQRMAGATTATSESREVNSMLKRASLFRGLSQAGKGKSLSGVEAEIHAEAAREFREAGIAHNASFSIPSSMMRAGSAGNLEAGSGTGSQFVSILSTGFVDALTAQPTVERAGIFVINGLTANVKIPVVSAAQTFDETGEGVDTATSTFNLGSTVLSPRRASGFVNVTQQTLLQGGADVERRLVAHMGTQMVKHIDTAAYTALLAGITTNTQADTQTANFIAGEAALLAAGADLAGVVIVAGATCHADVAALALVSSVNPLFDRPSGTVMGYNYFASGNLTATKAIMGNFNQGAVLGYFGGISFNVNPYSLDLADELRISCHRYYDVDVTQEAAMVELTTA